MPLLSKRIYSVMIACAFLAGCGDDESPAHPPTLQTGYLVAKLIDHVPYDCGSHKGKTGRMGQFQYMSGDTCTFAVGRMTFPVAAAKLQKGYITAYDLVGTNAEAWTLMAILESIAYRRPDTDQFTIIDGNLERRIPLVALKDGDAAVAAALAPFKGSIKPVTVRAAQLRMLVSVRDDNSLVIPLETMVAQGKAVLDSLEISTVSGEPFVATGGPGPEESNHSNRVNLRIYDNVGNPLAVNAIYPNGAAMLPYGGPGDPNLYSVWVTPGQNPKGSTPQVGFGEGDLTGINIFGIDLDVGRKSSDYVGTGFQDAAFWPGAGVTPATTPAPISIMAYGANPSASENTSYPPSLNFAFSLGLLFGTLDPALTQGQVTCQNLMFSQGSTKASLAAVFNFVYDLADTTLKGIDMVADDGTDVQQDTGFLKSFNTLTKAAVDLATTNWWVVAVNAQTQSFRMTITAIRP